MVVGIHVMVSLSIRICREHTCAEIFVSMTSYKRGERCNLERLALYQIVETCAAVHSKQQVSETQILGEGRKDGSRSDSQSTVREEGKGTAGPTFQACWGSVLIMLRTCRAA